MPNERSDEQHAQSWTSESLDWLADRLDDIPSEREIISVSEWAETVRYLPPSVTPIPGPYDWTVCPPLKEIADTLSIDSPIREVAVQKGVQICATTGILENAIGYIMEHVKSAPVLLLTADAELAKLRMESYITPMIQDSGLQHLIRSSDDTNKRKTGKTDRKIEWVGGGFLIPLGALNPSKLRSFSAQYLLRDEIDAYPERVGRDGSPMDLSFDRTSAFEEVRKVADLSTPLLKDTSNIVRRFKRGDQRYYFVKCLECRHPQALKFKVEKEGRQIGGLVWETENGRVVPGSVRYKCEKCGRLHTNEEKTKLLAEDNAEWVATADPIRPDVRSYHLSALYSPVGFQSWETCVLKWTEAWDTENARPRDIQALQAFYNNVLAEPFERIGGKIEFRSVSQHRRMDYRRGEVPNEFANVVAESPIGVITCAVDVHAERLNVATYGWTRGQRAFVIDYWKLKGNALDLNDPGTWGRLREILETTIYTADDGKKYGITITLIDAGYEQDLVATFCGEYATAVYPIIGRDRPSKVQKFDEFRPWVTKLGTRGFAAVVDVYKDRWGLALRKAWSGQGEQPKGHFNAPIDLPDEDLMELTKEQRRVKVDKATGREIGYEWHRPSGAPNELWDLLVYNSLALDLLAWDLLIEGEEMEFVDWSIFWDLCFNEKLFYTD